MKNTAFLFILAIFITFPGCTKGLLERKYLGKQAPVAAKYISDHGKHFWKWPDLDIAYDYRVSSDGKKITFNGYAVYNKSIEDSKFKHETVLLEYQSFILIFMFIGSDNKVHAVEVCEMPTGTSIMEKAMFEFTVPYKRSYWSIITSFKAYAQG